MSDRSYRIDVAAQSIAQEICNAIMQPKVDGVPFDTQRAIVAALTEFADALLSATEMEGRP